MSEKSPFAGVFARHGGRIPRNMTLKVINDYLDEVDAPTMEPSALEAYTSQMRTGLAEVTQRHIAKSVAQMTAWNWSRGRSIEELTRRFQEEQKKEQIDMSKVLPNAETVVRTESMKILNAEAWRSATEVGSYADGLLWGFSYHAVGDSRTRETHLAQHGVCAPVDDPFWNEWTPPNGYNCRCWLISEWEEPSSYKQPRRDLHPDPGFAFNPANNVAGRVPQPKKQEQKKTEPKKPEVNTQPEPVVKPDEPVQNQEISSKYEKNIQKTVTTPKKKRYNNMGVSKSTVKPNAPRSPEPLIPEVQNGTIIPTPDGKFLAIHGPMVKTTKTREAAEKAIREAGGKVPERNEENKNTNPNNLLRSPNVRFELDDNDDFVPVIDDRVIVKERKVIKSIFDNNSNKEEAIKKSIDILQKTLLKKERGLTQETRDSRFERCICIDKAGKLIAYNIGSLDGVNAVLDKGESIRGGIAIHTHPEGAPPSGQDIKYFLLNDLEKSIIVVSFGKYIIENRNLSVSKVKLLELAKMYSKLENLVLVKGYYKELPAEKKQEYKDLAKKKIKREPDESEFYEQYEYLLKLFEKLFGSNLNVRHEF